MAQSDAPSCSRTGVASAPTIAAKPMSNTALDAVRNAARVASSIASARSAYLEIVNEKSPCVLWPSLPTAVHTVR